MAKKILACIIAMAFVLAALTCAFAVEYKELRTGSRDSGDSWAVYSLQLRLKELGLLTGTADGIYGAGTANAVRKFQEQNGLEPTGVADKELQELLFSSRFDIEPDPAEGDGPDPTASAPAGDIEMSEVEISIAQSYLFMWGFSEYRPDGKAGQRTRDGLKNFMDYSYGDMEAYTERQRLLATPEPTPEPTPTPAPGEMGDIIDVVITPEPTISRDGTLTPDWLDYMENVFDWHTAAVAQGDRGGDVWRLQRRLLGLKYLPGGVDGNFGEHTRVALAYFQRLNGLEETGILDADTQEKLFSSSALESDRYVTLYKAMVSVKDQRVYIYKWTGSDYTALTETFLCSTGTVQNPTILGTYQAVGRSGEWFFMTDSNVWVRYAFKIEGGYFFHSVLFPIKGGNPTSSSVRSLGNRASHGCIRLAVEDAKWIYDNCSNGMTVTIYDD